MAYLVDTEKLLKLGSSKKNGIFGMFKSAKNDREIILGRFKDDFDELDVDISDTIESDDTFEAPISSREVLDELLHKNISNSCYGHIYAYVFKILCEYIGETLDNSDWYSCTTDDFYSIPYMTHKLPILLPGVDDFPDMTYINHEEVDIPKLDLSNLDGRQASGLLNWLKLSVSEKKDIFLFYH